jgi:Domain of unknown function (DUF389)
MHHTVELSLTADATDTLLPDLEKLDGVVALWVHRGDSIKPPGDVITVHTLNRTVDDVLRLADGAREFGEVVVSTDAVQSLSSPAEQRKIDDDADESPWEEFERGLRHNGRVSKNYLVLMALGGAIVVAGLLSPPVPQAVALVASAILAPAFEPVAKLALGVVRGSLYAIRRALFSIAAGYVTLAAAGGVTFLVLRALGLASPKTLASSEGLHMIVDPTAADWLVAAGGAVAGLVIVTAFREAVLAGALVALALVPAAATIGIGLVAGDVTLALEGLQRTLVDMGLVVVLGAVVVAVKQVVVHRRRKPLS